MKTTTTKAPKFVAYARVSTKRQGASGLGLDAQRDAVERFVEARGGRLLETVVEVESGKRNDRPELARAMRRCRLTGATLLVAKLDRLSREQSFIHGLRDAGVAFVVADMPEANTLTIGTMASMAEYERELISERTKAGLAVAKARGTVLGNPKLQQVRCDDTSAARAVKLTKAAARNAEIAQVIAEFEAEHGGPMSLRALAAALNAADYRTAQGRRAIALRA